MLYVVTVPLEYLTDCSIEVSTSCIIFLSFLGGGHFESATAARNMAMQVRMTN